MISIRPATRDDLTAIRALESCIDTAAHWSERDYDALFAPEAPKRIALVACDSSDLRGFIVARCTSDEWEIENVVVATGHRRQGIGSQLVGVILNSAEQAGAASVLLEVRESNLAARQLYEQLGFTEQGRRVEYYRDPIEDAILLRRSPQIL